MNNLQRFLDAQEGMYSAALQEMRNGKKRSHWIWYIFPQIAGLGKSSTSKAYEIIDKEEAIAYYQHPVLGERLKEISGVLLENPSNDPVEVMSSEIDARKLKSSMTLFALVAENEPVFQEVLNKYYGGRKCGRTMRFLGEKSEKKRKDDNLSALKWLTLLMKINGLNRSLKEPGWDFADKNQAYELKDRVIKKLLDEKPNELEMKLYYLPYFKYSTYTKDRAGDLMRQDMKREPFEYYLSQVPPCEYDIELPEKATVEIIVKCMGFTFSFHQPANWMKNNGIQIDDLPKKPWIGAVEFHHQMLEKSKEEILMLIGEEQ